MPSLKNPLLTIAVLNANVAASGRLLNLGATVDEDIGTELITRAQASSNTGGPSFGSNLLNFGVISRFYSITYANALSLDFG